MTVTALADPPPRPHAVPARPPRQGGPKAAPSHTITVTLHVTLGDDLSDAAAALRQLMEQVAALGDRAVVTPVTPVRSADPPEPEAEAARLDPQSRTVTRGGAEVHLCRREFDLLWFLAEHPGRVFTRGQLLNAVWGDPFTGPRTVDVHIRRLRQKLGTRQPLITTVRGIGYRLASGAPVTGLGGPGATTDAVAQPAPIQRGAA